MDDGPLLVLAAHADDEALGCGGAIAKAARAGTPVIAAFLTDGVGARSPDTADTAASHRRRQSTLRAAEALGVGEVRFASFPDNQLDQVPLLQLARHVEALVAEFGPRTVLTHHAGDLNIDHRLACQAVATACRPQPGHPVRHLWSFEVASSTEWPFPQAAATFAPSGFVDITATLDAKLAALDAYGEEMRHWPHARSSEAVTALARWRGATIGCDAAEAFVVQRTLR